MTYCALAMDGDGTLTRAKVMATATRKALEKVQACGCKLLLVTGETPKDLQDFPHLELFDLVVAENGGVLYWPTTGRKQSLGPGPPATLVRELRRRKAKPLKVGSVVVATETPYDRDAREIVQQLRLDYRIIYNRHEVMLLPSGIDKGTGLQRALRELKLTADTVMGVGDAENDGAMLKACGCGAAVANAVDGLKKQADVVTQGGFGRGIRELIERMHANNGKVDQRRRGARTVRR